MEWPARRADGAENCRNRGQKDTSRDQRGRSRVNEPHNQTRGEAVVTNGQIYGPYTASFNSTTSKRLWRKKPPRSSGAQSRSADSGEPRVVISSRRRVASKMKHGSHQVQYGRTHVAKNGIGSSRPGRAEPPTSHNSCICAPMI